jgi:cell division protein ZipA
LAAELRWILLGLGLPLLACIWWWTARRAAQTPGNAQLRETKQTSDPRRGGADTGLGDRLGAGGYAGGSAPDAHADDALIDTDVDIDAGSHFSDGSHPGDGSHLGAGSRLGAASRAGARGDARAQTDVDADVDHEIQIDDIRPQPEARNWGVPPFEPLSIRTADFDQVPVLDGPMMVDIDSMPAAGTTADPAPATVPAAAPAAQPTAAARPAAEQQRILSIRVCAVGEARWPGVQLINALEQHGLAFGRYEVFHRKHSDGRSLFCVASLIEPGTFDLAAMPDQEFRGVTLFAVLPGPSAPLDTMDQMLGTARRLAEELSGMVQDGKGMPLSPQRAAAMREDIARFQDALSGN